MRYRAADGAKTSDHLEAAAAHGNADAVRALRAPDFPDALAYLYDRFRELDLARGEGMTGLAPLTHQTIAAYADLMAWRPEPHEVQALLLLDAVTRHPEAGEPAQEQPVVTRAWPTRKAPRA